MNVDYPSLEMNVLDGSFRQELESELTVGFRQIRDAGERLPSTSHYASQIAAIVGRNAPEPLPPELAFHVYQEILLACEHAREAVLGEGEPLPS
ncbi:MAG TPA: hypothetical protein VNA04_01400 [Thermoanaerobaculia bacterium]|nr:hypothetical protein [Thermoanaerobaculia bacterium]